MFFLFLLLLISVGGSIGGSASAIAQKHQGKTVSFNFILENMFTGAAASVSMFFLIESLLGISPNFFNKIVYSEQIHSERDAIILALNEETIIFTKLFSLSVVAGFTGIPLMNSLSKHLISRVAKEEEDDEKIEIASIAIVYNSNLN